jgi:hypothetical protein
VIVTPDRDGDCMIRCFFMGAFESFPDRIHDLVRLLTTTPCRDPNHTMLAKSHAWCVSAVAEGGGADRIYQAIGEGDIGWWARDDGKVDWALCCLARNLAAEVAVEKYLMVREQDPGPEETLDLMTRFMTPRAWTDGDDGDGDMFDCLAGALSQVMVINVLIVSRSEKPPYACWATQCLGAKDSTEFQIRVLSYGDHYFWWRPSGAGVLRDSVCIQQVKEREEERKRKSKNQKKNQKKKKIF